MDQGNFSEAKIQQDAITHIRNQFPETYGCLYHIANGGYRDPRTATILTGQGVVPGVQDLHLIWAGKLYLIEVKTSSGQVDPAQKVVHAQHKKQGFDTYIFRTSKEIISFVEYVLKSQNIDHFNGFISPFSKAENLHLYQEEYRVFRQSKFTQKSKNLL